MNIRKDRTVGDADNTWLHHGLVRFSSYGKDITSWSKCMLPSISLLHMTVSSLK